MVPVSETPEGDPPSKRRFARNSLLVWFCGSQNPSCLYWIGYRLLMHGNSHRLKLSRCFQWHNSMVSTFVRKGSWVKEHSVKVTCPVPFTRAPSNCTSRVQMTTTGSSLPVKGVSAVYYFDALVSIRAAGRVRDNGLSLSLSLSVRPSRNRGSACHF